MTAIKARSYRNCWNVAQFTKVDVRFTNDKHDLGENIESRKH